MGQRVQSTFEVTEYEPGHTYGFKIAFRPAAVLHPLRALHRRGATQVTLSIQANIVNWAELNENILEKKMKRQFKENLTMLKNILETS